jgi:hypothetical protein
MAVVRPPFELFEPCWELGARDVDVACGGVTMNPCVGRTWWLGVPRVTCYYHIVNSYRFRTYAAMTFTYGDPLWLAIRHGEAECRVVESSFMAYVRQAMPVQGLLPPWLDMATLLRCARGTRNFPDGANVPDARETVDESIICRPLPEECWDVEKNNGTDYRITTYRMLAYLIDSRLRVMTDAPVKDDIAVANVHGMNMARRKQQRENPVEWEPGAMAVAHLKLRPAMSDLGTPSTNQFLADTINQNLVHWKGKHLDSRTLEILIPAAATGQLVEHLKKSGKAGMELLGEEGGIDVVLVGGWPESRPVRRAAGA